MRRVYYFVAVVTVAAAVLASSVGCASWGDKQKKGTGIGAAGGGVVGGAVIGHKTGSTARGAIIGAVVGGGAGALIGDRMDKQAEKLAAELEAAQVSRVGEGIAVTFDSGIVRVQRHGRRPAGQPARRGGDLRERRVAGGSEADVRSALTERAP